MNNTRACTHRGIVLSVVGAVALAALGGAGQGGAGPAKSASAPAAPAQVSQLSWAEVLEQAPDSKVVTDPEYLKRITETKLPWRVNDKATGIEMLLVPPGKFVMGMSPGDSEAVELEECLAKELAELKYTERPAHEVTISTAFYLGRFEVTQEQWVKVMGQNPSHFQPTTREALIEKYMAEGLTKQEALARAATEAGGANPQAKHPVESVSWNDCQNFCAKTGMRLPSEAEWEYACRAGVRKPRYGELDRIAWHGDYAGGSTHPVAGKFPNALGFHDMIGNVWEWCQDWFEVYYYKSCEDGVVDPRGPTTGSYRVLRGGAWYSYSSFLRSSLRISATPGHSTLYVGFRVARAPS